MNWALRQFGKLQLAQLGGGDVAHDPQRPAIGNPLLHPDDDCIVALATDALLPQASVPVLMLDDIEGIANVLQAEAMRLDQIGPPLETA